MDGSAEQVRLQCVDSRRYSLEYVGLRACTLCVILFVCVCLAVWGSVAPFRVGWDHVVCTDCFGGRQEGPAGSGRRALWLAKAALQPANQPDTHARTHTRKHKQHHAVVRQKIFHGTKIAGNCTLLSMQLKRFLFFASVVWLGAVQSAACQCVSAELVHGYKHRSEEHVQASWLHEDSDAHWNSVISADLQAGSWWK